MLTCWPDGQGLCAKHGRGCKASQVWAQADAQVVHRIWDPGMAWVLTSWNGLGGWAEF